MQVPAASAVAPTTVPVVAGQPAQVLAGNLATLPIGSLLQATVSGVTPREAILTVNGQTLTVRTPPGLQLQTGAAFLVRIPPNSANTPNPTLELNVPSAPPQNAQTSTPAPSRLATNIANALTSAVGRSVGTTTAATPTTAATSTPSTAAAAPRLAVVDVLAQLADGTVRVQIDGAEQTATPSEPLVAGGRYVLQVSQSASGPVLKLPPDSPSLPTEVAIAILRNPAPTLATALEPLQAELAALTGQPTTVTQPASTGQATTAQPTSTGQTTTVPQSASTTQPSDAQQPTVAALPAGTTQPTDALLPALTELLASGGQTTPTPTPAGATGTAGTTGATGTTGSTAQTTAAPTANGPSPTLTTNPAVQKAANAVLNTLSTFLPTEARPLNANELQNLITNGGLHFEAKLGRLTDPTAHTAPTTAPTKPATVTAAHTPASGTTASTTAGTATGTTGATTSPQSAAATQTGTSTSIVGPDLKADLLNLLQTVQSLGGAAVTSAPAAAAALGGLEAQQATNALAQSTGAPYYLQVPFPDGAVLRTLHLSLEQQYQPTQSDNDSSSGRFRVFMHVPLTDLGETWIDAGVSGDQLRATIYLDQSAVRDRVQAALPELQTQLQSEGFSEVLLSVKSSSDLPDRYRREAGAMQAGRPASVSLLDVKA